MTNEERLVADFRGTGLTVGPHPMMYHRAEMTRRGIRPASELPRLPNGKFVKTAGCVIARQRPGTAHGFVFLSLEDETGIANAIITPDLFEQNRLLLVSERFLLVEGMLQNVDNVVSVKAESRITARCHKRTNDLARFPLDTRVRHFTLVPSIVTSVCHVTNSG